MRIRLSTTWPAVEDYFEQETTLSLCNMETRREHRRHNPLGTDTCTQSAAGKD